MPIRVCKIRTYAHLDTWSRRTKQSQTKPILPDFPLPATPRTSLTYWLKRTYTTTPQSQKQSQTNPISPVAGSPTKPGCWPPRVARNARTQAQTSTKAENTCPKANSNVTCSITRAAMQPATRARMGCRHVLAWAKATLTGHPAGAINCSIVARNKNLGLLVPFY